MYMHVLTHLWYMYSTLDWMHVLYVHVHVRNCVVSSQDLTNISPRRYESKTVPTKGVGSKVKRKATDNGQVPAATKKSKG